MKYYQCSQCYHLKTKLLTVNNIDNIENIKFTESLPVKKHLQNNDYCRIWFCKREILPTIYTREEKIMNLSTPTCPCYEGDEV